MPKVRDPRDADALDGLVGYAYGAVLPVFLEIIARREPRTAGQPGESTASAFSRRLARLKARSPLTYLPPACVAKLLEVSDDLTGQAAQSAKERVRAGPPRAKVRRLPWD